MLAYMLTCIRFMKEDPYVPGVCARVNACSRACMLTCTHAHVHACVIFILIRIYRRKSCKKMKYDNCRFRWKYTKLDSIHESKRPIAYATTYSSYHNYSSHSIAFYAVSWNFKLTTTLIWQAFNCSPGFPSFTLKMINHCLSEGDSSFTSTITLQRFGWQPINISRFALRPTTKCDTLPM